MRENVLQFYPSSPNNDLLDYYLVFKRLEKEIVFYKDPESVPSDAKQEFILARRKQLKLYGLRAQKIIDWWAKIQAIEHKLAIEEGRIIPIRVGKEYGEKISKHKYQVKIIYEHRRSFLPDTPENRAITTVDGFKSCCGEAMVLMSAIDAGRSDPALKRKIQKIAEGISAKFLFLGKALLLADLALIECEKLIKTSSEESLASDSLVRLKNDISEFVQYSGFDFVHKDNRTGARGHGLATRDARLREIAQLVFQVFLQEHNYLSEPDVDGFSSYCGCGDAIIIGPGDAVKYKENEERFNILLADEARCKILNDYFVDCGRTYPDSFAADYVEKIKPIVPLNVARSYIAAHLVARRKAKAELGLIHGVF